MEPGFFLPLRGLEKFIPVSDIPSLSTGPFPKILLILSNSLGGSGAEPEASSRMWLKSRVSLSNLPTILTYMVGTPMNIVQASSPSCWERISLTCSLENSSSITIVEPAMNEVWRAKHKP